MIFERINFVKKQFFSEKNLFLNNIELRQSPYRNCLFVQNDLIIKIAFLPIKLFLDD
jgi:hypothetical protein